MILALNICIQFFISRMSRKTILFSLLIYDYFFNLIEKDMNLSQIFNQISSIHISYKNDSAHVFNVSTST